MHRLKTQHIKDRVDIIILMDSMNSFAGSDFFWVTLYKGFAGYGGYGYRPIVGHLDLKTTIFYLLVLPAKTVVYGEQSFRVSGSMLWNSLPQHLIM